MMTLAEFLDEWHSDSPTLTVHTSGSTGRPKAIQVEKSRMQASARMTCSFLGLHAGQTALLCLPLDYIAGKMMVVRALTCGLRLIAVEPGSHPLDEDLHADFAAMVPLQVACSLETPEQRRRLEGIGQLIIGGGAVDDALAETLRHLPNNVWSTYGMTETLSHIALRRLSGPQATRWYTPLEGISIAVDRQQRLVVDAPALCPQRLTTRDLAEIDAEGRFRILGRCDNVVCSGGVKIQIEEVERLLRPHVGAPFCITRQADSKLGEAVVMLTETADTEGMRQTCRRVLPRLWQPRRYITVPHIPLTPNGKIAWKEAEDMARQANHHSAL